MTRNQSHECVFSGQYGHNGLIIVFEEYFFKSQSCFWPTPSNLLYDPSPFDYFLVCPSPVLMLSASNFVFPPPFPNIFLLFFLNNQNTPHIFTSLFLWSSKFNVKKRLDYQRRVDVDLHRKTFISGNSRKLISAKVNVRVNYCARNLFF